MTRQWNGILLAACLAMTAMPGCTADSQTQAAGAGARAERPQTAVQLTESDLQAYEKGLARETSLVLAARERGNNAKTAEDRALAAQDEWEDQTIPRGASASGLSIERYRRVRSTVNRVLETLDFQGKIDGPLEVDIEHAPAELKKRLSSDPYSELDPASAAALHARMSSLLPIWLRYINLTAVNG